MQGIVKAVADGDAFREGTWGAEILDELKPQEGDKAPPETPDERSVDAFFLSGLSNRELDVLLLLGKRLTNKEISERLYISPITVKTHTAKIYRKLKVNSRRQAVVRAIQLGLLNE